MSHHLKPPPPPPPCRQTVVSKQSWTSDPRRRTRSKLTLEKLCKVVACVPPPHTHACPPIICCLGLSWVGVACGRCEVYDNRGTRLTNNLTNSTGRGKDGLRIVREKDKEKERQKSMEGDCYESWCLMGSRAFWLSGFSALCWWLMSWQPERFR